MPHPFKHGTIVLGLACGPRLTVAWLAGGRPAERSMYHTS